MMIRIAIRTALTAILGGILAFFIAKLAFYGVCRFGGHNTMELLYGTTSPAILAFGSALLAVWLVAGDRRSS